MSSEEDRDVAEEEEEQEASEYAQENNYSEGGYEEDSRNQPYYGYYADGQQGDEYNDGDDEVYEISSNSADAP